MPKVDNYIKFLNAFYVWEQQNPLTPIQECILMRILRRVNASGWCEWVKISGFELINELRISCKNTFVNNRNRLIELGLIEYKAGKKGKPSSYRLNMPEKKQIIYSFKKQQINKEKGMINIPNNIPKNNENSMINIPKNIPNSIPYFIPNNPQTSHEQCVSDSPKHKTINNKLKNKVNTNVFTHTKNNCADVLSGNKKYDDVLSLYNDTCLELSKVIKLSAKRKKQIDKMFCLGYSLEDFKKVFESTQKSSFLCGKANDKSNWRANFDWLIKEDNFLKVLEGNYQDLSKSKAEPMPKTDASTNISDWI